MIFCQFKAWPWATQWLSTAYTGTKLDWNFFWKFTKERRHIAGGFLDLEIANMERDVFIKILAAEGFEEAVTVMREPGGFLDMHAHPFEAKALIVKGELLLKVGGAEQSYQVGQVFHLPAATLHSEQYGPQGVEYLVGRRFSAPAG